MSGVALVCSCAVALDDESFQFFILSSFRFFLSSFCRRFGIGIKDSASPSQLLYSRYSSSCSTSWIYFVTIFGGFFLLVVFVTLIFGRLLGCFASIFGGLLLLLSLPSLDVLFNVSRLYLEVVCFFSLSSFASFDVLDVLWLIPLEVFFFVLLSLPSLDDLLDVLRLYGNSFKQGQARANYGVVDSDNAM